MIFYFMDYGVYVCLGEIVKLYYVDVWIICVMMENFIFFLLNIFV